MGLGGGGADLVEDLVASKCEVRGVVRKVHVRSAGGCRLRHGVTAMSLMDESAKT